MTQRGILVALFALTFTGGAASAQESHGTDVSKVVRLNRAPVNKEILRVHLPQPKVHKLGNGLTVLLLEDHKLPTISLAMWIPPGALKDPADEPGLASFTADMLREGTSTRSSAQIANAFDALGAGWSADASFGSSRTSISSGGLAENANAILELVSDLVRNPAFPADELEKMKKRALASLEQERSDPYSLGDERLMRALYGDTPAGTTMMTKAGIEKISRNDLVKLHAMSYQPENAILAISGDFSLPEMTAMVERYFGSWANGAHVSLSVPATESKPTTIYFVDRPGSVQSELLAGDPAIARNDPDFPALQVANRILGGGASARLFLILREEKSYTYGAYSSFRPDIYPGPWIANTEVRNAVTGDALHDLLAEIARMHTEAVGAEELGEAERSIIAEFALALERPGQVLGYWLTSHYYGLPDDYWDTYPERIGAVTAEDVKRVAGKYMDTGHLQIVCVGDGKEVRAVVAKFGQVIAYDQDGKRIP